jgi:hypothetical protein
MQVRPCQDPDLSPPSIPYKVLCDLSTMPNPAPCPPHYWSLPLYPHLHCSTTLKAIHQILQAPQSQGFGGLSPLTQILRVHQEVPQAFM